MIDSHAHVNFGDFDPDREEVIKRALDAGIWMINVGCDRETGERAVETAERYKEGVYAAVGIHPSNIDGGTDIETIAGLARSDKVVAIGETGLDHYNRPKSKVKRREYEERQADLMRDHLDLAERLDLPVMLHCRAAHGRMVEILGERKGGVEGVVHCFTGGWEDARAYLNMGLYIGFTGIIFKLDLKESIKKMPLDRMLIETDCPYLTPPSMEGRNEPSYLGEISAEIASLRGVTDGSISEATTDNATRLFGIERT